MRHYIKRIPLIGPLVSGLYSRFHRTRPFAGSAVYWERRYRLGESSGVGSYQKFAEFKAEVINELVAKHSLGSVIEFGCGDGNQLRHAMYREYLGFDVSDAAIEICRKVFAADSSKAFKPLREYGGETADLSLSLDVMYHLVEDVVFEEHVAMLFKAAQKFVVVYSSNTDDNTGYEGSHVFHRKITRYIEMNVRGWELAKHIPNRYPYRGDYRTGSFADFYIYKKH